MVKREPLPAETVIGIAILCALFTGGVTFAAIADTHYPDHPAQIVHEPDYQPLYYLVERNPNTWRVQWLIIPAPKTAPDAPQQATEADPLPQRAIAHEPTKSAAIDLAATLPSTFGVRVNP